MRTMLATVLLAAATIAPVSTWAEQTQPADGRHEVAPGSNASGAEHGVAAETETPARGEEPAAAEEEGIELPVWSVGFFVLMLLVIAVFPLAFAHFWEKNRNKFIVACILGLPVGIWLALGFGREGQLELYHVMLEYVAFMFLLGSLYIISGGIVLSGDLKATPATNTAFLAVGALLASLMGTTGAAMLLIRPVLSTNKERKHKVHTIIFFTFLVANIGGSLTPLGDPPLFMGYLRGVPFAWTLRLAPQWGFACALLLLIYYLWDRRAYAKESKDDIARDAREVQKLGMRGLINMPLLAGVVASVAFGQWLNTRLPNLEETIGFREVVMGLLALASVLLTKKTVREANEFTYAPIVEVAALFFGIFLTMIPPIVLLQTHGQELPVRDPWHFFWAAGGLSSFLDNTPTYVVFFELGAAGLDPAAGALGAQMVEHRAHILAAISCGAVFMGANTYIGNGPNFMVKAISDARGVKMPSFFGYMLYSVGILIPLFVVITLIFFRQ